MRVVEECQQIFSRVWRYLFSADRFVAIEVPSAVKASLLKASRA